MKGGEKSAKNQHLCLYTESDKALEFRMEHGWQLRRETRSKGAAIDGWVIHECAREAKNMCRNRNRTLTCKIA